MKTFFHILVLTSYLLSFSSCNTKKTIAEKLTAQTAELTELNTALNTEKVKVFSYQLSASPDAPLVYTHQVKGKVVERITLSGGTLSVVNSEALKVNSNTTSVSTKTFSVSQTKQKHVHRTSFSYWWLLLLLLPLISYLLPKRK